MTPPPAGPGGTWGSLPPADGGYATHYRLLEEIGRGGQGIVYLAEDKRTGKRCALKVLRDAGTISAEALERLRREVEAAARLHHPGICGVLEAKLEGSTPYIAMRYIEGQSLAHQIGTTFEPDDKTWVTKPGSPDGPAQPGPRPETPRAPSGPTTRGAVMRLVTIIEKAARALHVAHEAKVVHRDIKPSNIMITPEGEPVVLDFGLAQFEDSGLAELTRTGEIWGTPAYLSPEQLHGKFKPDRRTDVWSLGVTLFECLTIRRPFEGATNNQIFHSIQSKDPPDPCKLNRVVPADLRVVIDTALEKDRDRRYETALALAEDLKAVREGRSIAARPIGSITRLTRWARRNPAVAASVLATFGVLLIGIVVSMSLVIALRSRIGEKNIALQQRDEESRQKDLALRHSEGLRLLAESSASLARDPGLSLLLAIEGADLAPDSPSLSNGAANEALAELLEVRTLSGHQSAVEGAELSADGTRALTIGADGDVRIWDVATGASIRRIDHPRAWRASFTPKGSYVITQADDTRVWNAQTGDEIARLVVPSAGEPESGPSSHTESREGEELLRGRLPGVRATPILSSDGARLLVIRGEAEVWDPESGRRISTLAGPVSEGASLNFSPDGTRVLTISAAGATVWDSLSGREIASFTGPLPAITLARFSADGRRIVAFGRESAFVLDCETEKVTRFAAPPSEVHSVTFNADGSRILLVTKDSILVVNAEDGKSVALCGPTSDPAGREARNDLPRPVAAFTGDGQRIVGASCEGTARVFLASTGEAIQPLSGHSGDVRFVAVSPKRRDDEPAGRSAELVLTGSSNGTITVSESGYWTQIGVLRGHTAEIRDVAFSKDKSLILTASADKTARVWRARTPAGAPLLEGHRGAVGNILFTPDGRRALTASSDGHPHVWSLETFEPIATLGEKKMHSDPQLSPDGSLVVALCEDGSAAVFDVATGAPMAVLRPSSCGLVAFSPDSRRIVTAGDDGTGYVWDATTGREIARLEGHAGTITFLAFCAQGARVVTSADDRTVRLWNADSGNELRQVTSHRLHQPALSPDGSRIVVISADGVAQICDSLTGEVLAAAGGGPQSAPKFSMDGSRVATEAQDGSFRISDAETMAQVSVLPRDDGDRFQSFSPDGRLALTSSKDGTAHLFEAATGRKIASIRGGGSPLNETAFSRDGRRLLLSSADETRVLDASTTADLWVVPRRHGAIKAARFSPDGKWLAAGYSGGLTRLWPADPVAKAREIAPRELTLAELDAHGIDDSTARAELRDSFSDLQSNEDLVATLGRRVGLSDRLRRAAIAAAQLRDSRSIAERLRRRSWADVVSPNADPEVYAMALQRAERALRLDPSLPLGPTTLGAAQYRVGLYSGALTTLEKASGTHKSPANSILIAMVHARLGESDQAVTALAGGRRMLEGSAAGYPDDIRKLLTEADAMLAAESRPAGR